MARQRQADFHRDLMENRPNNEMEKLRRNIAYYGADSALGQALARRLAKLEEDQRMQANQGLNYVDEFMPEAEAQALANAQNKDSADAGYYMTEPEALAYAQNKDESYAQPKAYSGNEVAAPVPAAPPAATPTNAYVPPAAPPNPPPPPPPPPSNTYSPTADADAQMQADYQAKHQWDGDKGMDLGATEGALKGPVGNAGKGATPEYGINFVHDDGRVTPIVRITPEDNTLSPGQKLKRNIANHFNGGGKPVDLSWLFRGVGQNYKPNPDYPYGDY